MKINKICENKKGIISIAPIKIEDASTYYIWMKKYPSIAEGIGIDKDYVQNLQLKDEELYIQRLIDNNNLSFTIYENSTNKPIGNYGIYSIDKGTNSAEVGGFIIDDYQGKGYGTEAVKLITNYAFKVLGVKNVTSTVYDFNKASAKTFEKNGFVLTKIKKQSFYHKNKDKNVDEFIYSISKEKFYNIQKEQTL